jgi:ABC-type dipeptide/oligopeptide/nickel transport system permease subunit
MLVDLLRRCSGRALRRLLNPQADLSRLRGTTASEVLPGRMIRPRHVLLNVPLVLGGVIVLALFISVLFGPVIAPKNPYLSGRHVTEYIDGELISPPFPPSVEYPLGTDELGRDTLSMLLYGTRNTLVAAAFITMARLMVGLVLGGWAGWNEGQLIDRLVMGAIQMLISVPMLLLAAILILALDIRRGLTVFIIALCAIGWGEIAQYVRAEFIQIKEQPYVESARAIGLNALELAVRHVLPNVLPALVVITLLEMGAVLMILGELGFVGVYIGGGTAVQVGDFTQQQYFTVPEWGAIMAGSRQWARAKPWMVFSPAAAFFVSVTGFNLLGEGLRRLIDRGIFNTALLLSWRVIIAAALITSASVYVIMTLGPAPSYRHLAQQVNQADLMDHVAFLSAPEMNGRGIGSLESARVAEYIAEAFERNGLSAPPGGRLQEVAFTLARPAGPPELALVNEAGQTLTVLTRWAEYSETVERHGGSGEAVAPVTLVVFPSQGMEGQDPEERYARFKGLDLRGQVALVLSGNAPADFDTEALIRGAEGVLIVSGDVKPRNQVLRGDYLEQPPFPIFRITPETADAILAGDGLDVEALQEEIQDLDSAPSVWVARSLEARVRMQVQLDPPDTLTAYNVMGLVRGSDAAMDNELVIISCHYDGLGRAPDGMLYPGANGNASGVAVMLEIIRQWHEQDFQPRRSVLFAAWGGGELQYSGAHIFRDQSTLLSQYDISSVIHLDRLGGADGDGLVARRLGGRDTLYDLLNASAAKLGVEVSEGLAMRRHYQQFITGERGDPYVALYGSLVITWGDPEPALDADTLDHIDPDHLGQAAEVVNLTLITAVHEPRY